MDRDAFETFFFYHTHFFQTIIWSNFLYIFIWMPGSYLDTFCHVRCILFASLIWFLSLFCPFSVLFLSDPQDGKHTKNYAQNGPLKEFTCWPKSEMMQKFLSSGKGPNIIFYESSSNCRGKPFSMMMMLVAEKRSKTGLWNPNDSRQSPRIWWGDTHKKRGREQTTVLLFQTESSPWQKEKENDELFIDTIPWWG